jgi:hypothetical protein
MSMARVGLELMPHWRSIEEVLAEERAGGHPRWCGDCRWWHSGLCTRETSRPWWERVLIDTTFLPEKTLWRYEVEGWRRIAVMT